jgi:hypothetical protein
MDFPTDLLKLEEIGALLRKARLLLAALHAPANDLDSLLSVAQSEATRLQAATSQHPNATVPVILSGEAAPQKDDEIS